MAEAVTLTDLVTAVLRAEPRVAVPLPSRHEPHIPQAAAPSSAATLVDVLYWHAERTPDRVHIHLREDQEDTPIRYDELLTASQRVRAGLRALGVRRGDTVAMMLRTEPAFFPAFLGTLMAGAVPVPMYPPFRPDQIEEYAHRQRGILRNAGARVLVTFAEALRVARLLRGAVPSLEHITTIEGLGDTAPSEAPMRRESGDPALIQYTSGSTGDPKGILLSHANLLASIRAIGHAGVALSRRAARADVAAGVPVAAVALARGDTRAPIALRGTRHVLPDGTWLFTRGPIERSHRRAPRPKGARMAGDGAVARRSTHDHRSRLRRARARGVSGANDQHRAC